MILRIKENFTLSKCFMSSGERNRYKDKQLLWGKIDISLYQNEGLRREGKNFSDNQNKGIWFSLYSTHADTSIVHVLLETGGT